MKISDELLHIAKMDLQASRVLYEKGLYPQSIFYFQQSVEKACKTFALFTDQVTEKELPNKIGHEAVKIYEKAIEHQVNRFKQLEQDLNKLPELKSTAFLKDFDAGKSLKEFEHSSAEIKEIKEGKDDLIFISSRDIRSILKEIRFTNKDLERGKRRLSKFKISERAWNKMKIELLELYNVLSKYDSTQYEEMKNYVNKEDTRLIMEKSIKDLLEPLFVTLPLSVSLYYLAVITLPHSIITRYPLKDLTPVKIYTIKLPIVRMLPKLCEVLDNVFTDLEV